MSSKNVLIVYAHPEPRSFNGALKETAVKALQDQGHNVKVSDLYSMQFKATTSKDDIMGETTKQPFNYLTETTEAAKENRLTQDILSEIEKLEWADLTIFQFPMHWFGVPAILKGWFDRVFVSGKLYTMQKIYSNGHFKGRKAVLSATTGDPEAMYGWDGINGHLDVCLWPIHNGCLNFMGFDVLRPQMSYSVEYITHDERSKLLDSWSKRLEGIFEERKMTFFNIEEFEKDGFGPLKKHVTAKAMADSRVPIGQMKLKYPEDRRNNL